MFAIARRPATLRLCLQRRAATRWTVHVLLGRRDDDDSGSLPAQRWQATMAQEHSDASVARLRSQMYAITSPRGNRAVA
eukprot:COSAG02_NODE_44543_length_365_cov_0.778195_1_plen_78_part_10